ncbi:aspartate/glutamate racemase family protein [Paenibacillus flagellatus]|uniref:Asp/Glu racemase n=1 Tax=Paenibacillus flagellatus TaxID=2211139 RepID=A0A2V5K6U5_9BACL|nr:aspartate/glutamate racemase family protein [Paenibacillus flagellatus]PYI53523.1 Asp/Glu racemase [Paenibacillus flagellatus]
MSRKLAIIHTTPVTVDSLKALARETIRDAEIVNFVDDSILPQLAANGGNVAEVEERWIHYAKFAEQVGADCILNACSSVGELVAKAQPHVGVPIVRIDEAMAEEAVGRGRRIGVAATVPTTLEPTLRLLRAKAAAAGNDAEFVPALADSAYRLLMAGDKDGHDRVLAETLLELGDQVDVVVLAQASMARVVETLPEAVRPKYLSSPRLGMERVKRVMEGSG